MIDFKKVYFGCADANTEANRNPLVFKSVFFDPHNYLQELMFGDRFILRGRKGDGKTAYSAQIKLISSEHDAFSYQRSLNNFNNAIFAQIKTYDNLGGNPYISFWKCVLAIECVGMLYTYSPNIQTPRFLDILDALRKHGFLASDSDISVTVTKLVEANSAINIKSVFQHNRKYEQDELLQGAEQIYVAIRNSIKDIYLQQRFLLILDGLDDILNHSEFKAEIITGLIRAAEELNQSFGKTTLSIKTIILIRDDILDLCRDPNLSKITRDSAIRLSWAIPDNPYESDLIRLVSKRIDKISGKQDSFYEVWENIFPNRIGTKPTLEYVLDNIIYRPRDILQFFIEVQKEFVLEESLTAEKVQDALTRYSDEYFVDAMRDELTGFFPNEAVTILPEILSKMGSQYFYLEDFSNECATYPVFNDIQIPQVLERLFNAGYIGQHRPRANGDFTVFSYRNLREKFHPDHECILHRGLMRALTI